MAPIGRQQPTVLERIVMEMTARGATVQQIAVHAGVRTKDVRAARANIADRVQRMTQGWVNVMERISEGWTNAQIAEELGTTANTVKGIVQHIYDALGVGGRQSERRAADAVTPRDQTAAAYRIWHARRGGSRR